MLANSPRTSVRLTLLVFSGVRLAPMAANDLPEGVLISVVLGPPYFSVAPRYPT
jgi:hypothetical protein